MLDASWTPALPTGPVNASTRLDSYVDRYAARTQGMTASEIRALFAVASRPEVVSLAGGMPNISGLPLDVVGSAIGDLIANHGPVALQYSSGQGDPTLREQICEVMALEGIDAHPDDVVVTVGSQQAVDLVTRIFCDPGDVVICEAPSYVGALGVFKAFQCQVVHAEMDADGLVPDALRQAIAVTRAAGKTIKFLYTIPNFHNPAGVTMSLARRAEILDICRSEGVLVLEDNPYGLLGFDSEPMRGAARRRGRGRGLPRVVLQDLLARHARRLGAGARTRSARSSCSPRSRPPCARRRSTRWPSRRTSPTHDWQGQIKQMREMYRERRDAMIEALHDFMPAACQWNVPHGGFFVWMTLPPGIDAKAMLPRAVTARVAYVPGTAFFADGFGAGSMRLSFCYPTPERIREGVRRLAGVLEEEMELRETFGATATIAPPPAPQRVRRPRNGPLMTGHPIVVLAGGLSHERDVSLRSGRRTAEALRSAGLEVAERDVDAGLLAALLADPPTCVVPMLHGESGEDGAIREVLDLLGVPYVGSGPAACRTAFDKPVAKSVVARVGITTPAVACACRTRRSASSAPPR